MAAATQSYESYSSEELERFVIDEEYSPSQQGSPRKDVTEEADNIEPQLNAMDEEQSSQPTETVSQYVVEEADNIESKDNTMDEEPSSQPAVTVSQDVVKEADNIEPQDTVPDSTPSSQPTLAVSPSGTEQAGNAEAQDTVSDSAPSSQSTLTMSLDSKGSGHAEPQETIVEDMVSQNAAENADTIEPQETVVDEAVSQDGSEGLGNAEPQETIMAEAPSSQSTPTVSVDAAREPDNIEPLEGAKDEVHNQFEDGHQLEEPHATTTAVLEERQRALAEKLELLDAHEDTIKQQEAALRQQQAMLQQQRAAVIAKKHCVAQELCQLTQEQLGSAAAGTEPPLGTGGTTTADRPERVAVAAGNALRKSIKQEAVEMAAEMHPTSSTAAYAESSNNSRKRAASRLRATTTVTFEELQEYMRRLAEFWSKSTQKLRCPICDKQKPAASRSTALYHLAGHLESSGDLPYQCPIDACAHRALHRFQVKDHAVEFHGVAWTKNMSKACVDTEKKQLFDAL